MTEETRKTIAALTNALSVEMYDNSTEVDSGFDSDSSPERGRNLRSSMAKKGSANKRNYGSITSSDTEVHNEEDEEEQDNISIGGSSNSSVSIVLKPVKPTKPKTTTTTTSTVVSEMKIPTKTVTPPRVTSSEQPRSTTKSTTISPARPSSQTTTVNSSTTKPRISTSATKKARVSPPPVLAPPVPTGRSGRIRRVCSICGTTNTGLWYDRTGIGLSANRITGTDSAICCENMDCRKKLEALYRK